MKPWGLILGLFGFLAAQAQPADAFAPVDFRAEALTAPTPDSLGRLIAREFATPGLRTRAIYSWITAHIVYNDAVYKPWTASYRYDPDPLDTATVWPSGDEMVARKVMRQRRAVCEGYSRLFKVLCDHAGLEAVVIHGFGRGYRSDKFKTNHTWNAVKLDSVWYLLDLTWAAGYINGANEYVGRRNDAYYLASPQQFLYEHYPENLRWILLPAPIALPEFKRAPFRTKNFSRYTFASFQPGSGQVEASAGDTLHFSLRLTAPEKARQIGADPFTDTAAYAFWPRSRFVSPVSEKDGVVLYSVVAEPGVEWIHLLYKDDVVLQYRLKPKEVVGKVER